MTNTIPNVPRELLERASNLAFQTQHYPLHEELRTILSAPSPAGVDGLEVVSNWVLFDAEADKPYIKKMLPEGFLAFFDCKEDARRAKANNPGTDYKRIDRVKAEDAQAIIDGLRGEVERLGSQKAEWVKRATALGQKADQQAQRVGELEGLLRDFAYHTQRREMPTESSLAEWADRIDAAPAAPAADASDVLDQAMYTLISIGYHENSGLVHELRQALATHRSTGVV